MNRPNILYIHSHDTGRCVQPYGFPVKTPNLQKLAGEGVLFSRAFCAGPTCSPSRVALLTGQYPHQSGMMGLAHFGWKVDDYGKHLVHFLNSNGYETVLDGVQHEAQNISDLAYSRRLKPGSAADTFLREKHGKPFFLSVGFFETHRDFGPPGDGNDGECFPLPHGVPDTPAVRADLASFAGSARRLDEGIGRVLKALDESGDADNTMVICTTDHGIAFPFCKCTLRDNGTGVMLIMRGPRGFSGGKTMDALVSHIDIFPTLCDMLGLEKPGRLEGVSLLPLLEKGQPSVRDEVYAEINYHVAYEPVRSVRTQSWKYIRRFGGRTKPVPSNCDDSPSKQAVLDGGWLETAVAPEELFDLSSDPQEKHNLAENTAFASRKRELAGKLEGWMKKTKDPLLSGPIRMPTGTVTHNPDNLSYK